MLPPGALLRSWPQRGPFAPFFGFQVPLEQEPTPQSGALDYDMVTGLPKTC